MHKDKRAFYLGLDASPLGWDLGADMLFLAALCGGAGGTGGPVHAAANYSTLLAGIGDEDAARHHSCSLTTPPYITPVWRGTAPNRSLIHFTRWGFRRLPHCP